MRTSGEKFISQSELARVSGYTQTYISLIETGRVSPSNRCKRDILRALNEYKKGFTKNDNLYINDERLFQAIRIENLEN